MKGLFQCPPRASPWVLEQIQKSRPERAKAFNFKASALSGRVGLTCETRRITPTGLYPGTPGVLETSDD